ncbi:MAG: 4-hydroxy-3-methylbut-2-enyl diphosphate reductase [Bacillota bacterium]
MQIIVGEAAGFCGGVKRAVELAEKTAKQYGEAYTLGELIHNKNVIDDLKEKNVFVVEDATKLHNKAIIIRSHGVPKAVEEQLRASDNTIIDATCAFVKNIHNKVQEYSNNGWHIVVLGAAEHPEVMGIVGWCNDCTVVADSEHINLPNQYQKYLIVAQTTFAIAEYELCKEKIEKILKNNAKIVEFFNSICYTTTSRQIGAKNVAKECQAVLVIGDKLSSNTNKLFKVASEYNNNVYFITNVSDIASVSEINNITKLGILAGASTPKRLIMEVINTMDQEIKVDEVAEATVTTTEATPEVAVSTEAAPVVKAEEPMTMDEAMKKYSARDYREGMKLKATIIKIEQTGVSVALDGLGKNDSGFINNDEMELDGTYNPENYNINDSIDVIIIPKTDPKNKAVNLSKKAFDSIKIEDEAVKKILEGEDFTLACGQAIKGGLLGKLGSYTIFVPASQLRVGYVKNLEEYVGKKLRLRILPPKEEVVEEGAEAPKHRPNPKRIVASQRIILEEEKSAREEAFWEVMQVNNIIKGKVKRFTAFGAFVSIMNFDCLAHISDLSWTKIADPSEVLELNKSYEFLVIKVDRESGKVSLGYKQLQKKPYELAAEKYHVDDIIKGKVERIKDFGAFIEIEPGIDGLVHVSEINHKWIANANEALKVGDEIEAKIIGFENNKITLSIKALQEAPVVEATEEGAEGAPSKRPSNSEKFASRAEGAEARKDKKDRKQSRRDNDEPREWVSSDSSGATFADIFKGIDMDTFTSEEESK